MKVAGLETPAVHGTPVAAVGMVVVVVVGDPRGRVNFAASGPPHRPPRIALEGSGGGDVGYSGGTAYHHQLDPHLEKESKDYRGTSE